MVRLRALPLVLAVALAPVVAPTGAQAGHGDAPTIDGPSKVFFPFGQALTIAGTAPAGAEVTVFFDRRGPEGPKAIKVLRANSAGRYSYTVRPGDDYTVHVSSLGQDSGRVVAFTTPTVDAVPGQYVSAGHTFQPGPDNAVLVLRGKGAPGSTFRIAFRQLGTPRYTVVQTLTVAANGTWTRPLRLTRDWAFFTKRGFDAPSGGFYVALGR